VSEKPDEATKAFRLLVLATLDGLDFKRQVWLMSKAGYAPTQIAAMLDSTANSVRVRLTEMRRNSKKRMK
jgi:hypothetical protein